ncbi:Nitrous oxide reductase maturation protein, outer-membrane lipoprotein NosL [hydrothermal vent metagenome]|uniref:Nitrous oxide reductase maturation protein, outer-membrane lipoprotein NosL n=1 Tax=hydrothermal vent metagenome TaxID=652676 RepID=A0A1W1BXG3_9ZZZZ
MRKIFLFLTLFASLASAMMFQSVPESKAKILQSGKEARYCSNCGMDLVKFYKTNHAAKVDNKQKEFCSIHCLAEVINSGAKVSDIKVVDTKSLKWIDATKAHYVVGSKVKGTMSRISKYAFSNLQDAKTFAHKYGGKIVSFKEALSIASKDFQKE